MFWDYAKTFSLNYKLTRTDKSNAGRVNDLFNVLHALSYRKKIEAAKQTWL